MQEYNPKEIESQWQNKWEENGLFAVKNHASDKENYYLLVEYPYPSGNLHIGHWYAFAVPDILARFKRMQGYNVLFPMGFDSFGLPAENAAIKRGLDPKEWTYSNIEYMTQQLKSMGNSFDWSRRVISSDPETYQWTQWLFLQLFEKGMAYRKKAEVNWCPQDQTVLANEQVLSDGTCERCSAVVEKRALEQWFLTITDYAEKLLSGLDALPWPEEIKQSQRNWIGKSEGAELDFAVAQPGVKRAVLLHGRGGAPDAHFFPWLKKSLEAQGITVEAPALPHSTDPDLDEQVEFVLANCTIDESTVVVGHSFGGLVAMELLARGGTKAATLALVATPATDDFLDGKERPTVSAAMKQVRQPEKYAAIKNAVHTITVLCDTEDAVVRSSDATIWAEAFDVAVTESVAHQMHFCGVEEPAVLQAIIPRITVFTTRPDTVFGATYLVLAPEHPLVDLITTKEQHNAIHIYKEAAAKKNEIERTGADKEKTGVFTGAFAVNPANGKQIPVWVADYALATYGTGAVMAVPAHDERDFEFAQKFELPIVQVVQSDEATIETAAYTGSGVLMNSGEFDGMNNEEAKWQIAQQFGRKKTTYKLRDWLISRQRYWGTPIPIVYDPEGKPHAIPKEHLPWTLPTDVDFTPTGVAPLATSKELFERTEKIFGKGWTPEIDTMDTFIDSSWYYLRYLDPMNTEEFSSQEAQQAWMPVDRYSGGAEHTTMHLLYSRFFNLALHDLGLSAVAEPYVNRMNRGLILGPDGHKMSKSKGNVIDPDEEVAKYGADTVKMYLAFIGPYNEPGTYPWDTGAMNGIRKFLEKVWRFYTEIIPHQNGQQENETDSEWNVLMNQTIKKVGEDIETMKFNTAISQLMICFNTFNKVGSMNNDHRWKFLKLLHPFAPHMTEELWKLQGADTFLAQEDWPTYDESLLTNLFINLPVQINGKMRGTVRVLKDVEQEDVMNEIKTTEVIQKHLGDATPKKIIYVPGKILNIIL